jgi:uncharacterized protein (TIGR00299 family) protein
MKLAYFDAGSGISGDMTVGALLDAGRGGGLTVDRLAAALDSLAVAGYRLTFDDVEVNGIRAGSFDVLIDDTPHAGHHHHHGHHRPHRDWATIRRLITDAGGRGLDDGTVERSLKIFSVLADAEARVHGVEPDLVHFHEVGAIDSIVDIVGISWCLEQLAIDLCFVGPLPSGSGYVDCEHGRLPVPAPATALQLEGLDVVVGDGEGELVTPTGAAFVKALARPARPAMSLERSGAGAGTRRLGDRPNILRVFIGEAAGAGESADDAQVVVIEADVDDMAPNALAYTAEVLRDLGARDVNTVASHMKKGRVGIRLTVVTDLEKLDALADAILNQTTTIGLRYRVLDRIVLPRRMEMVETEYGTIALKVVGRPDGTETAQPESDDVARAARKHGASFADVSQAALEVWRAG